MIVRFLACADGRGKVVSEPLIAPVVDYTCPSPEFKASKRNMFQISLARLVPMPGILALAFALASTFPASVAAATEDGFRKLSVQLDHSIGAAPIDMRLRDGAGLLAVGMQDEQWRYSVISLADGEVVSTGVIPAGVFFYDTGDPQGLGTDRVCFFTERGVSVIDPASGELREIFAVESLYHGQPAQGPVRSDFVRDVDGDEADDILAPLFSGWLVARQSDSGFDRFLLEIRPRVRAYETRVSYQPREPRLGDVDGDGRDDLMFLRDREFLSFLQSSPGRFELTGRVDAIDAPLASEAQRSQWERDDGQVDQSDLEIEEVELVQDFDGDGVVDLLTEKEISEGVFDRRSEYHLYLGDRGADALTYAREADGSIASDGIQFIPIAVDVDGDGLTDIATPSTKLGLTRIVGALFSGRIGVDLDVYRMREGGGYPDASDYQTRFKVEFDLDTGLTRFPAVKIADVDGDGAAELLVQEEPDELTIYPGVGEPDIFGEEGRVVSLPLPSNGQMVEARDLDGDDRADIMVRYGPADGDEFFGQLRVLISAPKD